MPASLSIGDFSRATQLSIKTLRHYHRLGLLEPSEVDPDTGYRRYTTPQIPAAQVIRRFRDLDMPLEQIRAVLDTPDLRARNKLISAHLTRLEQDLARTQHLALGQLWLLHLHDELGAREHFRSLRGNGGTRRSVLGVIDTDAGPGARFDRHFMSSADQLADSGGHQPHPVLMHLDLFRNTDTHATTLVKD